MATGQWTGTARISKCGRPLLRWALYQAALGAARTAVWRARREAMLAKRQGDRYAFLKANIELAAKLLRIVWGVWRSGRAYEPAWGDGPRAGRRAAPPSGQGPAAIVDSRGSQAGRVSDRRALYPKNGTGQRGR